MKRILLIWLVILFGTACSNGATESPATVEIRPDCVKWENVDPEKIGEALCVYGYVASVKINDAGKTVILFSTRPNTFFLTSTNQFSDLDVGDCVQVTHVLLAFMNERYMDIDDLSYC